MFDIISLIILREIFINIINQIDLTNFKFSLKRINNFVKKDQVCQEHYLQKVYNLNLDFSNDYFGNYENLISSCESRKYSQLFHSGFNFNKQMFVRPSDNNVIIRIFDKKEIFRFRNSGFFKFTTHLLGRIEDESSIIDSIKYSKFEKTLNSMGYFQINPKFLKIPLEINDFNECDRVYEFYVPEDNHDMIIEIHLIFSVNFIDYYIRGLNHEFRIMKLDYLMRKLLRK